MMCSRLTRSLCILGMDVADDMLPGEHRQFTRSFKSPFGRASREEDYRTAWAFFQPNTESQITE